MLMNAAPKPGDRYLSFDGYDDFVEIPNQSVYSVSHTWELTVAAWLRADIDDFPNHESGGPYVHWLGKGEGNHVHGSQEWVCRMYNLHTPELNRPRPRRTSFYVFNPEGGLGVGSYVQTDPPVNSGVWRLIVAMADMSRTYLYCDGEYIHCNTYRGMGSCGCPIMTDRTGAQVVINPSHGPAPLRIGTQDKKSFFLGGIAKVRIWNRLLSPVEIQSLYLRDEAPRHLLAGEFLLNEGQGTIAYDSARGNDGIIYGAAQ